MLKIIFYKSIMKKSALLILILNLFIYPLFCNGKEEEKIVDIGLTEDLLEVYTTYDKETVLKLKQDTVYQDIVINNSIPYSINFQYITFKGKVIFHRATFEKAIYFLGVKFENDAVFREVTFKGGVYFDNVSFDSDVSFFRSIFEEETSFNFVEFHKKVIFNEAEFRQNTYFSQSLFNQQSDFSYTKFPLNKILDFTDSNLYDHILFYQTSLPEKLIFKNILVNQEVDFTSIDDTSSADICYIDLYGTTIDKIKLSYEKFRLCFDNNLSFDQKSHIYQKLLSKQKNDGFINSHKKLDLEYQKFYHSHGSIIKKMKYSIEKYWWNFGYNKERVFFIAIILLFVFSFINYWKFSYLIKVYSVDNIRKIIAEKNKKNTNNIFKRILLVVKYFTLAFYYTGSIFFGLKMDIGKFDFSKPISVAYILFIYLSGLICVAYMFNFIISL